VSPIIVDLRNVAPSCARAGPQERAVGGREKDSGMQEKHARSASENLLRTKVSGNRPQAGRRLGKALLRPSGDDLLAEQRRRIII